MLILAFDTTNERGGVGLFRGSDCLAMIENRANENYSVSLFEMVERIFPPADGGRGALSPRLSDVELFAVAVGPGSFTGIRVGIAAAQGWATALGRPVRGVSVLEALVEEARPRTPRAAAILDARRGEFFLGLYEKDRAGSRFKPVGDAQALAPAALAERLRNEPAETTCLIREHDRAAAGLRERFPEKLGWCTVPGLLVAAIARIAIEAHGRGELQSPAELDALYIRRSDAEMNWELKSGRK